MRKTWKSFAYNYVNGKVYNKVFREHKSKRSAMASARHYRKNGYYARVYKEGSTYWVYRRKKYKSDKRRK